MSLVCKAVLFVAHQEMDVIIASMVDLPQMRLIKDVLIFLRIVSRLSSTTHHVVTNVMEELNLKQMGVVKFASSSTTSV